MLIKCPECELQISDKAMFCPHCGYPIKPATSYPKKYNPKKRKRLPNGFGQISEIKNRNLRNRFRAMVTVGKTENGKPICKLLQPKSYFSTYNEAYAALVEYNRNPYNLSNDITIEELYNRWSEAYFNTITVGTARTIKSAWKYCHPLYKMKVLDVRVRHMKQCLNEAYITVNGVDKKPTITTKSKMKSIFNLIFDYAIEYEIVDKNYARTFDYPSNTSDEKYEVNNHHIIFEDDEMKILWDNLYRQPFVDMLLIQCYSGWRPNELISIKIENIDINEWIFVGGGKTKAGKNRIVPIHPKIQPLVQKLYDEAISVGSKYLFNREDYYFTHKALDYGRYALRFQRIIKQLGLNPNHRPHDGRMHFITMAKKYNLDEYAIKHIVGHAITDITEKIYTKREISWLRSEIEKIK